MRILKYSLTCTGENFKGKKSLVSSRWSDGFGPIWEQESKTGTGRDDYKLQKHRSRLKRMKMRPLVWILHCYRHPSRQRNKTKQIRRENEKRIEHLKTKGPEIDLPPCSVNHEQSARFLMVGRLISTCMTEHFFYSEMRHD